MNIEEFITYTSSLIYGKVRYFEQDDGKWYDRHQCDYVDIEIVLERLFEEIKEEVDYYKG